MHDASRPIHATLPHLRPDVDVGLMSAAEQQAAAEVLRERFSDLRARKRGRGTPPRAPRHVPHLPTEAAALLVLTARHDPEKLEATAVRFLGRACLERSFMTLSDTQLLATCLDQLARSDAGPAPASRPLCGE